MRKLVRATPIRPPVKEWIRDLVAKGVSRKEAKYRYRELMDEEMWKNDLYTVIVERNIPHSMNPQKHSLVWLSIRRNDRAAVHDWRHLQQIKNQLVGPECEGVEIYPAESRLVDTANQYHLFVLTDPDMRVPFGWPYREVSEDTVGPSRQRPFEDGDG